MTECRHQRLVKTERFTRCRRCPGKVRLAIYKCPDCGAQGTLRTMQRRQNKGDT